ncbi:MAG: phage integrase SAM-like domain-containing protein [Paludibacter sp.]|nr:phage integrase SAM-like domain-containing protein [Paludibacter sp.]
MKYSITYALESKNNRDGEVRIRLRIRWSRSLVQYYIPFTINPAKWSKDVNRCRPNTTHGKHKVSASLINSEIQKYENAIERILKEDITIDEFKKQFAIAIGKTDKKETHLLSNMIDLFVNQVGFENTWSERTYKHFKTIKNHLVAFDPKLTMDLTEDDMYNFMHYLQTLRSKVYADSRGLSNNTISKYISKFRWFLRWANKKGYYTGDLHLTFKPKLSNTQRTIVYLKWDELINLFYHEFKTESLAQVRDVFCFCCFTSLRYSDVANLKKSDIHNDYISIVTKKTHEQLRIELNDYSKEILNKYKDASFKNNLALPVISNQKMNDYLKSIGKELNFDEKITNVYFVGSRRYEDVFPKYELLTTHCGRRTFIVNAIYLGIPAEVVMKWTGHEDYESMKPYIAIVDELKSEQMAKFNKKVRQIKMSD